MGYLKGRFSSLRGIRLRVDSADQIKVAVWWVIACMAIHNFAMNVERQEDSSVDKFFKAGLTIMAKEHAEKGAEAEDIDTESSAAHDLELLRGQLKREILKRDLFEYLDEDIDIE
jgi:hypothetical protein